MVMGFLSQYGDRLAAWWSGMSSLDLIWFGIGLAGQLLFVLRWLIQWIASERAGRLVVPDLFWYASLAGGLMVLSYGVYKPDPIIVIGQFGVFLYARNVYFLWRQQRLATANGGDAPGSAGHSANAARSPAE
jgi:lipid-A-disaccharide synthase-like uncharacterized protein